MVFNIGDYEVIEGLDLVVQSMYKNELSIVSIKVIQYRFSSISIETFQYDFPLYSFAQL